MDSYTSEGKAALKSRYVDGVLTFYQTDGTEIWSISPVDGAVSFTSAPSFGGGIALGDSDPLYLGAANDVSLQWNGSVFLVLPVADDTGAFNVGNGTLDMDFRVTLGATGDYLLMDVGNKSITMAGDVRLDLSAATVAAANTDGGVIKAGTSGSPVVEDTANMKFMSFYFDNGATSGESVGLYCRQYVTGAGGEGIAARIFGSVTDVAAGNARGAHISQSFGATGRVTGSGYALETTLHVPSGAGAWTSGTYASLKVAISSDASTSDPAGATEVSFIRIDNQGDATGAADIDTDAFLLSLQGFTAGASDLFATGGDVAAAASLKIKIGATPYYILLGTSPSS